MSGSIPIPQEEGLENEFFIDLTGYLSTYQKTPRQIGEWLMRKIKEQLGLPATCGIGTNMYLAKGGLRHYGQTCTRWHRYADERELPAA